MFDVAFDQARRALDKYPDEPNSLSDNEAAEGFAQLQRISELVEAKRLRWLADQDRRSSHRHDGYVSTAAWLADRFGVAAGSAKRQVQTAQALEEMPKIRESFVSGDVTSSAVQVLVEAHREHPEAFRADEGHLLAAASSTRIEALRRFVGDWIQSVDEQHPDRAEILHGRRHLDVCPTPTRMVHVDSDLHPEGGEVLMTALQAVIDAEIRSGAGMDARTPAQRRADALCELAYRYLNSSGRPSISGERPHITLTVPMEALRDGVTSRPRAARAQLDNAGAIEPIVARRVACDASITRAVMAAPSEPLDVGRRTPVVSAGLRRALVLRDQGCRFPACTRPPAWTDAHHVVRWADGGETALRNLILLCRPHHRLVHEGGFKLEMETDGPVFKRPNGSMLEERRAPP